MFADPGQVAGFAALMSDVDKPFECVGERRESAVGPAAAGRPAGVAGLGRGRRPGPGGRLAWSATRTWPSCSPPTSDLAFADPAVAAAVDALLAGDR